MKIRILGCGFYGAHLAVALLADGHDVEVHELADDIFTGASGGAPARIHLGFHYPRSGATQAACRDHFAAFMESYGHLTAGVPVNLYAVAKHDSLVDFVSYCDTLRGKVEFVTVQPEEHGLENVEGAVLTGERHIVVRKARDHFLTALDGRISYGVRHERIDDPRWDLTVDCTFCANDDENIDRFEPCVMVLLKTEDVHKAVTIMDGPFGSIYPFDEANRLVSLTSAKLTPISKITRTWREARMILDAQTKGALEARAEAMVFDMARFYPAVRWNYEVADFRLSIRAMPRSGADSRLVDVVRVGERALRVRAGKIDAVFHAARIVKNFLRDARRTMKQAMVA